MVSTSSAVVNCVVCLRPKMKGFPLYKCTDCGAEFHLRCNGRKVGELLYCGKCAPPRPLATAIATPARSGASGRKAPSTTIAPASTSKPASHSTPAYAAALNKPKVVSKAVLNVSTVRSSSAANHSINYNLSSSSSRLSNNLSLSINNDKTSSNLSMPNNVKGSEISQVSNNTCNNTCADGSCRCDTAREAGRGLEEKLEDIDRKLVMMITSIPPLLALEERVMRLEQAFEATREANERQFKALSNIESLCHQSATAGMGLSHTVAGLESLLEQLKSIINNSINNINNNNNDNNNNNNSNDNNNSVLPY